VSTKEAKEFGTTVAVPGIFAANFADVNDP
jgi:hypothetical protein